MNNPLLNDAPLPDFTQIHPEHAEAAIDQILAENRRELVTILAQNTESVTWETLLWPLQLMDNRLDKLWSPVRHLNSVMNSPQWRSAYNACLPKLSDYSSELGQHKPLYLAFERLSQSAEYPALTPSQQRVIELALRDFRLSGVHLEDAAKTRLRAIDARLSELTSRYEENVLDATQAWTLNLETDARLSGLPDTAKAMLAQNARQRETSGYCLTLDFPSYYAVITYADDRALRETVYYAYMTRASDQGPLAGQYDNGELMLEILALRAERAQLTGFANHAERSLATKMASSINEVETFLLDLARRAQPYAEQELDDMRTFARTKLGMQTTLEVWDYPYVAEKIRQSRFGLSQEMLKPYFPAEQVMNGLFRLVEQLFQVRIETGNAPVWHPDVTYYRIVDLDGQERAGFYLDLYARQNKRGGAWMDVCRSRYMIGGETQLPVAYMTCNSTPPVDDQPALFTHDEVVTLFHEFGHGLHHMLTRVDEPEIAGISGVEWDAVELPSQFMENWCWEEAALAHFARHYATGEPLPKDLLQRLQSTRQFQAALQLLRQAEFALFDLRLHSNPAPGNTEALMAQLNAVRAEVAVIQPPAYNRFPYAFTHIFAGGYAAGYYSYKWAEVLSADAFARFEEEGLFAPEVGEAYRREILEVGASRPALVSFQAFRGRAPQVDALLRHSGLANEVAA